MISIIICDDDIDTVEYTREFLCDYLSNSPWADMTIDIKCYTSPTDILSRATDLQPDILLLDIHMPKKNGFEIAEVFHNNNAQTKIIFLTNYEQFVFYSLRFSPFRFIRKSKLKKELPEAIDSSIKSIIGTSQSITLKKYSDVEIVPINTIKYIEKVKYKNYLNIVCTNGNIQHRDTIQYFEEKLKTSGFAKINSGTLVNMKYIKKLSGTVLILMDGTTFTVSSSNLEEFKKALSVYLRFDN